MPISDPSPRSAERKRKRGPPPPPPHRQWATSAEHRSYSAKLLDALRRVRPSSALPRSRAVRAAADRTLAVAARGRTRWSRAILSGQPLLRLSKRRPRVAALSCRPRKPTSARKKERSSPAAAVEAKAELLGRLVPGCRKLAFPKLLEEASDYIAALEMQVRTMAALAEILSASSIGPPPPPLPSSPPAAPPFL